MLGVPFRPDSPFVLGALPKLGKPPVGAMLGLCGRIFVFKISMALCSSQTWQTQLNIEIYLVTHIHDNKYGVGVIAVFDQCARDLLTNRRLSDCLGAWIDLVGRSLVFTVSDRSASRCSHHVKVDEITSAHLDS
jgi:hypothetical protein